MDFKTGLLIIGSIAGLIAVCFIFGKKKPSNNCGKDKCCGKDSCNK